MATVTGLTAARMLAIEAKTVTGGSIDASGHLILNQTDGGTIDAGFFPPASETVSGVVELATAAETAGGTDNTRAVSPASLSSTLNRITELETATVKIVTGKAEADAPSAYPSGISMQSLSTGSGWSLNLGFGSVITHKVSNARTSQTFYSNAGGTKPFLVWTRSYHDTEGGGGWTAWQMVDVLNTLTPGSFTQNTVLSSYPLGQSRLYYSAVSSSAWDFIGKAGEVLTYRDGNDFGKQTFTRHVSGSTAYPEMWIRTANEANGWSKWTYIDGDSGWTDLALASGYTALGTGEVIQYRVKNGVVFYRGGATGSYPAGSYQTVVAPGGIPATYRPPANTYQRGGAMGTGLRPGGWEIGPDGSIKMGSGGLSAQPTWMAFSASYPIN